MSESISANPRPYPWHVDLEDASAAPSRRTDFVQYLRANGRPDDDYAAAELIFGELVGNAYLHARGPLELAVEWSGGHAILHVTDQGGPVDLSAARMPTETSEHGRVLALVRALAPSIHATTYPGYGKTISVALPVRPRDGFKRMASPVPVRYGRAPQRGRGISDLRLA